MTDQPDSPSAVTVAARFDLERTRIAYEQLMMSWIRTATSLITFGFSIYKFFQLDNPGNPRANVWIGPRSFAMSLVIIGLGSLALATWEYRGNMRVLRAQYLKAPSSLSGFVAALISFLGIIALLAMLFRR
jgi:inner membrane protein YidH